MSNRWKRTPEPWVAMGKAVHIRLSNGIGPKLAECPHSDEAHGNAYLMAAAPDLLAACEAILGVDTRGLPVPGATVHPPTMQAQELARKALSKAKGES